jgi:hypothetical protein
MTWLGDVHYLRNTEYRHDTPLRRHATSAPGNLRFFFWSQTTKESANSLQLSNCLVNVYISGMPIWATFHRMMQASTCRIRKASYDLITHSRITSTCRRATPQIHLASLCIRLRAYHNERANFCHSRGRKLPASSFLVSEN